MRKKVLVAIQRSVTRKIPVAASVITDVKVETKEIVAAQISPFSCTKIAKAITADEADELLKIICKDYDRNRMTAYMADAHLKMLDPVINAFGLGSRV